VPSINLAFFIQCGLRGKIIKHVYSIRSQGAVDGFLHDFLPSGNGYKIRCYVAFLA